MEFYGEVVFSIADEKPIVVDFGEEVLPTKIVNKGKLVALGRRAPKNKWNYEIEYNGETEFLESLEKLLAVLCKRKDYISQLTQLYEEVSINAYIRSDWGQISYSLQSKLMKELASLDCAVNFDVLSYGMVRVEKTEE